MESATGVVDRPKVGPARVVENGAIYLGDRAAIGVGNAESRLARLGQPDARFDSLPKLTDFFRQLKERQVDFIAPFAQVEAAPRDGDMTIRLGSNGTARSATMSLQAERQLCALMKIPADYFSRCPEDLRAAQMNYWLPRLEGDDYASKRMFRLQDDRVRALLTAKYERVPHLGVSEVAERLDLALHAAWLSHDRMDLALYDPNTRLEVNGGLGANDPLYLGVHVTNGETGQAPFEFVVFLFRAICCNYNIWGYSEVAKVRAVHRGEKIHALVNGLPRFVASIRGQKEMAERMVRDSQGETLIDFTDKTDKLVASLKTLGLSRELSEAALVKARGEFGGRVTRWSLVQGLTSVSQTLSVDRRAEVDKLAGLVLAKEALVS